MFFILCFFFFFFFFFNDTATTEIYTLSLHDALPIFQWPFAKDWAACQKIPRKARRRRRAGQMDRERPRGSNKRRAAFPTASATGWRPETGWRACSAAGARSECADSTAPCRTTEKAPTPAPAI